MEEPLLCNKESILALGTNEDLVNYLMRYNQRGALCQLMIINAITVYTNQVVEQGIPPSDSKGLPLIIPEAWYLTAFIANLWTSNMPEW